LGAIALVAGFAWAATLQTGYCGRYPPPSGWVDVALIAFALGIGFVIMPLSLSTRPQTRASLVMVAVALAESAAAIALVFYVTAGFVHAYDCG
jgi:hypothetical protein